jgi:hypothetical protein
VAAQVSDKLGDVGNEVEVAPSQFYVERATREDGTCLNNFIANVNFNVTHVIILCAEIATTSMNSIT